MTYSIDAVETGRSHMTIDARDAGAAAAAFMDTLDPWVANVAYNYERPAGPRRRPDRVVIYDDIDDAHPVVFVVHRSRRRAGAQR